LHKRRGTVSYSNNRHAHFFVAHMVLRSFSWEMPAFIANGSLSWGEGWIQENGPVYSRKYIL